MSGFPGDTLKDFIIFIIICLIIGGCFSVFSYGIVAPLVSWGIMGIIILLIAIIIILVFIIIGYYNKSKMEHNILEKNLRKKSINLNKSVIVRITNLNDITKKKFCEIYGIQPITNENIAIFISKNFPNDENGIYQIKSDIFSSISFGTRNDGENMNYMYDKLKGCIPTPLIKKILIRDNYTCQKCGKTILEFKNTFTNEITYYEKKDVENPHYICYIKPIYDGGTITEDNLIAVCHSCSGDLPFEFKADC